ncbi:LamG domain-containing protein [Pontiella desulfatans]|nr:LamG domain-containing protein [Pontiella desulfatans]
MKMRAIVLIVSVVFSTSVSLGYEVWYGMPYLPANAGTTEIDQWDIVAPQLQGINANFRDAQRPEEERNTRDTWKASLDQMPNARNNALVALPRPEFQYSPGGMGQKTLEEALQLRWNQENQYGITINYLMLYNERPQENPDLPVIEYTDAEVQQIRDWLDNNGHSQVILCWDVRSFAPDEQLYSEKPAFTGIMMEGSPYLWESNSGRRKEYIQWALANPLVKDKEWVMQTPVRNISGMNLYESMRWFMRYIPQILGGFDFWRRDDVSMLTITYGPTDKHLPELESGETQYGNSIMGFQLSIIEQKALFEGYHGAITEAQAESRDRIIYDMPPEGPASGLLAHWPLDEGSGTIAGDASGYGFDGELLNGVTWGSDAERGTYAVFDGVNDRITTPLNNALADTNDFTWAWWAKSTLPATDTTQKGAIMVGNRYGNTGDQSFEFIKFTPQGAQLANTDNAGTIEKYEYADIPQNEWHHYAMVKTGTSYQWYVDGVAQGVASNFVYSESSTIPFLIGGDDDGSGTKVNEHFQGCIDDVVLYRQALTPTEIDDVINGIYLPTITLVTLGTPVDSTEPTAWSDGQAPHGGADYVIPDTGNLRGESGTTTFPGASLKVEAGGKFQVRSLDSSSQITTVNNLILAGGTGANYTQLAAGTGTGEINVLDGKVTNSGASRLVTYASVTRSLKVLSQISGDGTLQAGGGASVIVDNAANTFYGTWEADAGTTLTFTSGGAVGTADVDVLDGGTLQILGTWDSGASLSVADTATTQVDLGSYSWFVSSLLFGGSSVEGGTRTASELNALGANSVFTGTGTLTVVPEGSVYVSAVYNTPGTVMWTCPEGITYIQVECWGGGGAGGGAKLTATSGGAGGGGAAAGAYARVMNVPVTPGNTYSLTIPAAATCSSGFTDGQRFNGSAVTFTGDGGETVTAAGGQGGACHIGSANGPAGIGSTTGCVGDQFYKGGSGGNYGSNNGGSGGGGPSDLADGGDGSTTETGGGGLGAIGSDPDHNGGNGANGRGAGNTGLPGNTPGGGGGGAKSQMQDGEYIGGSGGLGQIIITYLQLPAVESPVLEHSMSAGGMVFSWTGSGFKVQSRTNLMDGAWSDVPGGDVTLVNVIPTNGAAFYRLIEQ